MEGDTEEVRPCCVGKKKIEFKVKRSTKELFVVECVNDNSMHASLQTLRIL